MSTRKNKVLFYSSVGLGILFLFIILLLLLSQTSYFLNFLKDKVESQASKQINGFIQIERIEGNIFSNLSLQNIVLYSESSKTNKKEIIRLDKLELDYSFRKILNKQFIISSIIVSGLKINLEQNDQGNWNISNIPLQKEKTDDKDIEKSASVWGLDLQSLLVRKSNVNISGKNIPNEIPKEINIKLIQAQANISQDLEWQLTEVDISSKSNELNLSLNDLQGNNKLAFSLGKLEISTAKSLVRFSGDFTNTPYRKADINFQALPIDFAELQNWLPNLQIKGNPYITGQAEIQGNSLTSRLSLNLGEEEIVLKAYLQNFFNPYTGYLNLDWNNIDLNTWKNDFPQSSLKGNLLAQIEGENWPEIETQLTLKLQDSSYNNYKIDSLFLESQGSPAKLINNIHVKSEFGLVNVKANIDSLLGEISYVLSGSVREFDIIKIIPDFPYTATINSQFSLSGKSIDPDQVEVDGSISLTGSTFADKRVEKLSIIGAYQRGKYNLEEMRLNYDGLNITAQGQGYLYGNQDLDYSISLDNLPYVLQELSPELSLEEFFLRGSLRGKSDNLISNNKINMKNLKYNNYKLASLKGKSEFILKDKEPEIVFTGSLKQLNIQPLPVDSILINSHYVKDKIFLDLNIIQSDTLDLNLTSNIFLDQQKVNLSKLEINAMGQKWVNTTDKLKINYDPNYLSLEDLELASDKQTITAKFSLKDQVDYDLQLKSDSLYLWPLSYINPQLESIEGLINLDISGRGRLSKPQVSVRWNIDDFSFQNVPVQKIAGSIDYKDDIASMDLEVNRVKEESISINGFLPLQANLKTNEYELVKDDTLSLQVKVSPLSLSNLNDYSSQIKEIEGSLNLSAKVENTLNNPQINAELLVKDLAFKIPTLGIDYSDINLDFVAHNNRLELKQFSLPSDKDGYLRANGSAVMNLKNTQLDSLKFNLKAKDWQVMKNRDMDLRINSEIQVEGNTSTPTFSGYLDVLRARLYLPALLSRDKKRVELTQPLLLANSTSNDMDEFNETESKKRPSQIMKNLRGRLKVSFLNNIWINSKEMNIELGGDIEVIKNSPDFALAGNVKVIRGNYTVYGRRFNIVSGNVYFRGESELNPELAIVADYIMRTSSQEKKTLSIEITGNLQQPSIQFFLDDEEISEGDGVSYIVFGRSTAQLSSGEKSQINNSGQDNLATKILVSQIASQVTSVLQNRLNLDVVELRGNSNWREAEVVVGKYLTNDLFLSYQKELSFGGNNEVSAEKITLEYEIVPSLFLQGTQGDEENTGLDLIWKYQK